jgi:glycerol-3-phosphate cytidylyltransferase
MTKLTVIGENVKIGENVQTGGKVRDKFKMKIGFTCGAFDILHAGHALMLEEAKSQCDYLIVGVQSDPSLDRLHKNKPVQFYEERLTMIKAIKYVDRVVLYDTEEDLMNLLKMIEPDVRIIGADWKGKEFTGHDLNIEVYFNSREHDWSTSNLRKRIYEAEKKKIDWNNARR